VYTENSDIDLCNKMQKDS